MKFLRILTLIYSAVACSAFLEESAADVIEGVATSKRQRGLNGLPQSVRMSFYEMEKGGKKGGKKDGKKGGKGGKGSTTGKGDGKGMEAPAMSPVEDCPEDTPGCGVALSPALSPVASPDCGDGSTPGCGEPVASPAFSPTSEGKYNGGGGSGKGGGKGGGGKKGDGGKGGKKGDGGKGKGSGDYPGGGKKGGPSPSAPSAPTSPGECGCEVDEIELDFSMLPYNLTVGVSPGASTSSVGTVFIFNDVLFDLNLTVLPGTFVGGLCHKTQLTQPAGSLLVGSGYCFFTFTVSDSNSSVTFNAAGEVFDNLGGTLAITGGTGALTGAYGEVELTPVYQTEDLVDFFTEASLYIGAASLFVPLF